jgi:CheY-like chemotaxis protein
LTTTADARAARVSVRDNGPGIPAEERARVFDRFHRVEATAGNQPGTGIGLALAKELAGLHGGSITVESEVGAGSTFVVTLPLGRAHIADDQIVDEGIITAPTHRIVPPRPELRPAQREKAPAAEEDVTTVLVIEDNDEVRAVRRHLVPAYQVEAVDGDRAGMARRLLPDLVLSDVMMPGMDGYALCRAVRATQADFIPVVLLAEPADRLAGLQGRRMTITKPFEVGR